MHTHTLTHTCATRDLIRFSSTWWICALFTLPRSITDHTLHRKKWRHLRACWPSSHTKEALKPTVITSTRLGRSPFPWFSFSWFSFFPSLFHFCFYFVSVRLNLIFSLTLTFFLDSCLCSCWSYPQARPPVCAVHRNLFDRSHIYGRWKPWPHRRKNQLSQKNENRICNASIRSRTAHTGGRAWG